LFLSTEDFRDAFCFAGGAFGRPCKVWFIFDEDISKYQRGFLLLAFWKRKKEGLTQDGKSRFNCSFENLYSPQGNEETTAAMIIEQ